MFGDFNSSIFPVKPQIVVQVQTEARISNDAFQSRHTLLCIFERLAPFTFHLTLDQTNLSLINIYSLSRGSTSICLNSCYLAWPSLKKMKQYKTEESVYELSWFYLKMNSCWEKIDKQAGCCFTQGNYGNIEK